MSHESERIFGLDIGTRSVVGLLLEQKESGYHVHDVLSIEHKDRSMLDGQIHNVVAVADTIIQVKEKLEAKHGKLTKVCVAAAGRALKTERATMEMNIEGHPIFNREALLHLELQAVQQAQFKLVKDHQTTDYCVGYSVVDYKLDNEVIGSLIDQRGEIASVEVIATFLPKVVVESLLAALERADLTLEALTLEPIAAINVLIPSSMRRLNVALVDIGAGTSDIAITESGTVTAYGMVPSAGDEITEALSDSFLLDFAEAEVIKRKLSTEAEVTVTDILGMEQELVTSAVVGEIDAAIERLASQISEEIILLNGRPPKAVMLVGGGSLTPSLPGKVAAKLSLPEARVAIRGIDAIKDLTFEDEYEPTPELVTPIGIAIAAKESPIEYVSIKVNEQTVRLFDMKQLTVADGLLASGVDVSSLSGKPGLAMIVTVDGRKVTIPGHFGELPVIMLNGEEVALDTPLHNGDILQVKQGTQGADAKATVNDVTDHPEPIMLTINGGKRSIPVRIRVNGHETSGQHELRDRDVIEVEKPRTLADVTDLSELFDSKSVKVFVQDREIILSTHATITINGVQATRTSLIKSGDALSISEENTKKADFTLKDAILAFGEDADREITVTFNDQKVVLRKELYDCYLDERAVSYQTKVKHGDRIKLKKRQPEPFIFQDVFSKVDIERPSDSNKKPVILQNNEVTNFAASIHHGDSLRLDWVEATKNGSSGV
ncbi:pilus assembly protein PilM [Paenalkalicoccus suaedae]|uniref:Pilus assembly protein PilM n=1 Tax=Paenalkalicoccus suaedae TaxID=2592382 RepID=A0A859FHF4_9BACI|nr:pilus assembly protein PilM [Paenalkalicoccus suaedae]QKS72082.1 pilus assembly protein PilM [Paenalkalicoccus suaedae]